MRGLVPEGVEILDAHAHLGADEDGHTLDPAGLTRRLDRAGVGRACVFALHDPDRRPAYRVPNDRVLDWAEDSGGRLVPFCRLDPADGAVAEAERCLARGARGIKLHPRSQAFVFGDGAVDAIFALAQEARVPILIHAGRGMPSIADGLCDVALRHLGAPLILAHGGIADLGVFADRLADHPAAFFDTSIFGPLDMIELFARVPPERILFGSDPPYGRPFLALYLTLRVARMSGLDDAAVRRVLGGTAEAILSGADPSAPSRPIRPRTVRLIGSLGRLSAYTALAFDQLARGAREAALENVVMALGVCRDPDPEPAGVELARAAAALTVVETAIAAPGARIPTDLLYLVMALAAT